MYPCPSLRMDFRERHHLHRTVCSCDIQIRTCILKPEHGIAFQRRWMSVVGLSRMILMTLPTTINVRLGGTWPSNLDLFEERRARSGCPGCLPYCAVEYLV